MELLGIVGPWQLVLILVVVGVFLLPIIALVSILRNEFTGSNKLIWILVVLLLPFLGAILYFIIGNGQKINKSSDDKLL